MSTKREDVIMIKVGNHLDVANPDAHWTQVDASNCERINWQVLVKILLTKEFLLLGNNFLTLSQNTM